MGQSEQNDANRAKCKEIASILKWEMTTEMGSEIIDHGCYLVGPADLNLFVRFDNRGKTTIHGTMPRDVKYNEYESQSIGVNLERDAQSLVNDINRRLMPGYIAEMTKAKQQRDDRFERIADRNDMAQGIAKLLNTGCKPREDDSYPSVSISHVVGVDGYGSIEVHSREYVKFDCTVTFDVAVEMVATLAAMGEIKRESEAS